MTHHTYPRHIRLPQDSPDLPKAHPSSPGLTRPTQGTSVFPRTYQTYPRHIRLPQDSPDLPKAHPSSPGLTRPTKGTSVFPRTHQTYQRHIRLPQDSLSVHVVGRPPSTHHFLQTLAFCYYVSSSTLINPVRDFVEIFPSASMSS